MINIANVTLVETEDTSRKEELELALNYIKDYHSYRWLYIPSVECTVWLNPYFNDEYDILRLGVVVTGKTFLTSKCVSVVQAGLTEELEILRKRRQENDGV